MAESDRIRYDRELDEETKNNGGIRLMLASSKVRQLKAYNIDPKKPPSYEELKKKKKAPNPNAPPRPMMPFFIYF